MSPAEGGRVIAAEADRLERLVFDLLDLARLGRAGFAVEHRPVDLAAVGATAVERHLPRARSWASTLQRESGDERRLGRRRRGPAAPGDLEPDRERAASHAGAAGR